MHAGLFLNRWDAHKAHDGQIQRMAVFYKPIYRIGGNAGLLWFQAGVDLDEKRRAMAQLLGQARQSGCQFGAV